MPDLTKPEINVDTLATESTVAGEIDTSSATAPVVVLTPPSGKRIDTRGVYLIVDSDSGECWVEFKNGGQVVAKTYLSRRKYIDMPKVRFQGDVNDSLQVNWSGLSTGAKIFYVIAYKIV